jgi:hypothetical protein
MELTLKGWSLGEVDISKDTQSLPCIEIFFSPQASEPLRKTNGQPKENTGSVEQSVSRIVGGESVPYSPFLASGWHSNAFQEVSSTISMIKLLVIRHLD